MRKFPQLLPYAGTVAIVSVVTLIKVFLRSYFDVDSPLTLFYTAVIASAWYGGRRQGFFAMALGLLAGYLFFVYPNSLWIGENTYGGRFLLFSVDCLIVIFVCAAMRSARIRAELALSAFRSAQDLSRESQMRFNRVYESNMIGLMTAKTDGTIVDCNDYVLNLLGYTRQDVNRGALNWREFTPPEYRTTGDSTSILLKSNESVKPYEKEYIRADGTRVPVMVGAARLADGVAVVFVLDIQERKRSEQTLEGRVQERTIELRAIAERLQQSQQFLDSVIENLPNMVFVKDARDLRFVRFNRAGEELLGYPRSELIGKNDYDLFPSDQADFFIEKDRVVLEGREVVDISEEPLSTKDGTRYLHTKKIPILDGAGNPIYLLGISEDITERKAAEIQRLSLLQEQTAREEAEKSAEQLRFLTEAGEALNESLDLKSRLDAFVKIVTAHLGDWCEIVLIESGSQKISESVISHRDPVQLKLATEFRNNHELDWEQEIGIAGVIRTGSPQLLSDFDQNYIASTVKNPARREALLRMNIHSAVMVPLRSYGRVIGALSISNSENPRAFTQLDLSLVMDLAKRASFAIENSRLYSQAQEASQAKSAFLANMSHEIRTPLGAMLGFAQLLGDDALNSKQEEYLATLLRNGEQLLRIVDEILDLSKVESDRIQIENVLFSPAKLIGDVVDLLQLQARSKGIELNLSPLDELPEKISSDPTRLRQILTNVIGNAVKFTLRGNVTVSARLHSRASHPHRPVLEITIKDTGIGISNEQRDRLFQAFVQADNSTTRKFGGTGLGLFLSRRLARLMGGDVVLSESHVGKGSCFLITTTVATHEAEAQRPSPSGSPKTAAEQDHKGSILIVDDAPDNRVLIELLVRRLNYQADVAATGREAVHKALSKSYSLILMDVQMPEMDGFEAVSHLRAKNYSGPIVALTAHTMKGDRERCLAGGFDGYLGKPIDRELLKQCLQQFVQYSPSTGASSDSFTH